MSFQRTLAVCALAASCLLQVGCGMTMDEGAAEDRGRKASHDSTYRVVPISAQVIAQLATEPDLTRAPADKDPREGQKPQSYTIAPFDVLQVTVWEHPELTTPAGPAPSIVVSDQGAGSAFGGAGLANGIGVDADGAIYYPHVGVLGVAGKTLAEVRTVLTDKLSRVLVSPQLDVRVSSFRGKRAYITGEVAQPGAMPLTDVPLRVQDAISFARGLTPETLGLSGAAGVGADPTRVTLTRAGKTYRLDLLALYERGDLSQNWLLEDGDIVHVGDRNRNRVFIIGEVKTQQAKLMVKRRMTLAESLSDSGFDTTASNPGKIYVIRGDLKAPSIYKLDASSADALVLAAQFQLHPLDVVFVSTYELTRWNRVIAQILPSIQLLYEGIVGAGVVHNLTKE